MTINPSEKAAILKVTIEEMRRTMDWLDTAYARHKTRTLAYLSGGLATLTFLYANGDTFIPDNTQGKIFYFAGLGLLLTAIAILLAVQLRPNHWEFSIENRDIEAVKFPTTKDFLASEENYLQYVKERYYVAYKMNLAVYEYCCKWQNRSFIPLLTGAIILAVLKVFR